MISQWCVFEHNKDASPKTRNSRTVATPTMQATAPIELFLPEECMAGVYIIVCDKLPNAFKPGWTRNINKRLWHATYDAFGNHKRYAYALLFRFRDVDHQTEEDTPVYRRATPDELEWIEQQLETQLLVDTKDNHDTQMGSEWRTNISVEECIERIQEIAQEIVSFLPEEIQPDMREVYNFRPHRMHTSQPHRLFNAYNTCKQMVRKRLDVRRGFHRWKVTVQAVRDSRANPQDTDDAPQEPSVGACAGCEWQEREYQTAIIDYCTHHLQHTKPRMYLELATGAGKSYINYRIFAALHAPHVLIFSPRKNINEQTCYKSTSTFCHHTPTASSSTSRIRCLRNYQRTQPTYPTYLLRVHSTHRHWRKLNAFCWNITSRTSVRGSTKRTTR